MNNLMIFEGNQVEVFELNGQVLFNPYHVAFCLGIADIKSCIRGFNNKQVVKVKNSEVHTMHFRKLNNAGENFLTESGVYKLIFKSRKEAAEKFQDWVTDEVLPSIRKTGAYIAPSNKDKQTEIKMMNAKVRMSNQFLKLANVETISKEYKQVLVSKATEVLVGVPIIPLPEVGEKTYSATEIGKILGVSKKKIGIISNKHNLKTDEYGKWFHDKSAHSKKEVETFRYYEKAIDVFRGLIEKTA